MLSFLITLLLYLGAIAAGIILALLLAAYVLPVVISIFSIFVPGVGIGAFIFLFKQSVMGIIIGIVVGAVFFCLTKIRKISFPTSLFCALVGSFISIFAFGLFVDSFSSFSNSLEDTSILHFTPLHMIPWLIITGISLFLFLHLGNEKLEKINYIINEDNIVVKNILTIISSLMYGLSIWFFIMVSIEFIGDGYDIGNNKYNIPIIAAGTIISFVLMFLKEKYNFSIPDLLHRKSINASSDEE